MKPPKRKCDKFFTNLEKFGLAASFGDVRAKTCYSEILPAQTNLISKFSRNVNLRMPIVSAPMDTVTESKMAIKMAKLGGLGIIHKALTPKEQASAVGKVKFNLNGFIPDPICVSASSTVEDVLRLRDQKGYEFFSFMVNDAEGHKIGLVTKNDFDFCLDKTRLIESIMSKDIISSPSGISIKQAFELMSERKKKILPIFSPSGEFEGIYTLADVIRTLSGDAHGFNLDASGSLCVGAAIGIGPDMLERLELLSQHRVDVIVIDTAHGNSKGVIEAIKFCKKNYPLIDVVAGNISEGEAAKRLVDAGADGLRVGQGPGSICTTRIVAGIGCPQVSAIYNCEKATRGSGVPICGDGGLETSGDIVIALAAGADCVMVGSLVAGTKESPGKIFFQDGKSVKQYRGMGSLEAMLENKASRERYGQENVAEEKLVAEGVKSWLNYKGEVENIIFQLLGGLRSGMGYIGAKDISSLHERADFHRISGAGLKESHPHGLDKIETETRFITQ